MHSSAGQLLMGRAVILHLDSSSCAQAFLSRRSHVMPQGVDMMTAKLTNSLRGADVTVRQAADAIKHLLHLHAEGARSTKNLDPVKLYLEAQVRLFSNFPIFRLPNL